MYPPELMYIANMPVSKVFVNFMLIMLETANLVYD